MQEWQSLHSLKAGAQTWISIPRRAPATVLQPPKLIIISQACSSLAIRKLLQRDMHT